MVSFYFIIDIFCNLIFNIGFKIIPIYNFYNSEIYENYLEPDIKFVLYISICSDNRDIAEEACAESRFSTYCEEIISYVSTTCETSSAPQHLDPIEDKPMTPEEEEIAKKKQFEEMKKKLYDEFYPELLENYRSTEAMRLIKRTLDLLEKELLIKN